MSGPSGPAEAQGRGTATAGRRVAGLVWHSGLPIAVNAISTLATLVIIPGLGPLGWGVWSTAVGLSGATSFLVSLGIRPLFIRAMARSTDLAGRNRLIGYQLAVRIMLALVAGVLSLGVGVAVGYDRLILSCAAIAALGLIPTVAWTVYSDVLNSQEEFRASAIAGLLSGLALTACSVTVVLLGFGPTGVAAAYLVGPSVTALQLAIVMRRRGYAVVPRFDSSGLLHVVREARLTAFGDGLGALLTRLRGIYLPLMIGPIAYGYYTAGTLLVTRLQVVTDSIVTVYTPAISRERAALIVGTPTWSSRTALRLLFSAGLLLGVVILSVSGMFTRLLYRTPELAAGRSSVLIVMVVTACYLPIAALGMGWRQLLIAVDQHQLAAKVSAVDSIVGALGTAALTYSFGIAGAAVGLWWSALASAILLGWVAARGFGGAASIPHWRPGVLSGVAGGCVAGLGIHLGFTLPGLLLAGVAPVLTLVLFRVCGVITPEDVAVLRAKVGPPTGVAPSANRAANVSAQTQTPKLP